MVGFSILTGTLEAVPVRLKERSYVTLPSTGLEQNIFVVTFSFLPEGRRQIITNNNTSVKFYKSLRLNYFVTTSKVFSFSPCRRDLKLREIRL